MKTTLHYFLCISFIMTFELSFSQSCKEIEDWMEIAKAEYPNFQPARGATRGFSENLAINLYSDKYYMRLRGKSFSSLSQNARAKDWRKIQSCFVKEGWQADPNKNFVFQRIVSNYHIDFRNTSFIDEIKLRHKLRQEFEEKLTAIKRDALYSDELQNFKKDLGVKYALLFPSELNVALSEIKKQEAIAADAQLVKGFAAIENLPLQFSSINQVLDFKSNNQQLFVLASEAQQQTILSKINKKMEDILVALMPAEISKLEKIEPNLMTVAAINKQLVDFKKTYRRVISLSPTQRTLEKLTARKTEIVDNMMPTLDTAIKNVTKQEELTEFSTIFLSDIDTTSSSYTKLKNQIEERQTALTQELDKAAKETIIRKKQERIIFLATNGKDEGGMRLDTEKLFYAEFFDYLYRGHSENIIIKRESEEFMMIFNAYISAFGKKCPSALPTDKVELMTLKCDQYMVTKEALSGFELYRNCTSWVSVGTGVFVKPELFAAKQLLESPFKKSALAYLEDMYTNPNASGNAVDKMHRLKRLKRDMDYFFANNDCTSKAVAQFEKNLLHFAVQKPLERLKGISAYEEMRIAGAPSGEQRIEKLIADIVQEQSETWAANKYIKGSISNVRTFTGEDGKTIVAYKANYVFSNMLFGNDTGAVTIRLKDGLPNCIIFADFPNNCKSPSASLLMAYTKGKYTL